MSRWFEKFPWRSATSPFASGKWGNQRRLRQDMGKSATSQTNQRGRRRFAADLSRASRQVGIVEFGLYRAVCSLLCELVPVLLFLYLYCACARNLSSRLKRWLSVNEPICPCLIYRELISLCMPSVCTDWQREANHLANVITKYWVRRNHAVRTAVGWARAFSQ